METDETTNTAAPETPAAGPQTPELAPDPAPPSEANPAEERRETDSPPPPAPPAAAAPPPASVTVANGTRTEREAQLEAELAETRARLRSRETEAASLADENSQLRRLQSAPARRTNKPRLLFPTLLDE
jgi:hypothetical protein